MTANYKMKTLSDENINALEEIAPTCNQAIGILLKLVEEHRLDDTLESAKEVKGTMRKLKKYGKRK